MHPYDQYWIIYWGPTGQLAVCDNPQVSVTVSEVVLRFELPFDETVTLDFATLIDESGRVIRSSPLNGTCNLIFGDSLAVTFTVAV